MGRLLLDAECVSNDPMLINGKLTVECPHCTRRHLLDLTVTVNAQELRDELQGKISRLQMENAQLRGTLMGKMRKQP